MHLTPEHLFATAAFGSLLATAAAIDLRIRRIPDVLTLGTLIAGFLATVALNRDLLPSLLGAVAGYGAFWLVSRVYRRLRGRDGLGLGDAKLLGAGGAWIGLTSLPFVVLIAAGTGLAFVGAARLAGRHYSAAEAIAFGPFLSLGLFITWCAQYLH